MTERYKATSDDAMFSHWIEASESSLFSFAVYAAHNFK